jgi:hypothetical protein
MSVTDAEPRAVLVVASTDGPLVVGVGRDVPCDLDLVDRLLWLCVVVRRLGWSVRLTHVDDELAELLELVGVTSPLGQCHS